MENQKMFEVALKNKFRFPLKGQMSTEDLFDLSVQDLDSIFKVLNSQLKQVQEESLLGAKSKEDQELDLKIEIIKYIVAEKLEEKKQREKLQEKRQQKQKLLEALSKKENEELEGKSAEELRAMLNELD